MGSTGQRARARRGLSGTELRERERFGPDAGTGRGLGCWSGLRKKRIRRAAREKGGPLGKERKRGLGRFGLLGWISSFLFLSLFFSISNQLKSI